MGGPNPVGWLLVAAGLTIVAIGLLVVLGPRVPLVGQLPGDIRIERDNVTIYLPVGTMLLVSVVASVVLGLLVLLGRR